MPPGVRQNREEAAEDTTKLTFFIIIWECRPGLASSYNFSREIEAFIFFMKFSSF
jgi:hypothetical protein